MSNKFKPHLVVIPEDDANRQIINGFKKDYRIKSRQINVETPAGGWLKALEYFNDCLEKSMRNYKDRHVLIVIDFDEDVDRINQAKLMIPADLKERVYILGYFSEPENIRSSTGFTKEELGDSMAKACFSGDETIWNNALLHHNKPELERMKLQICSHLKA